ncbi:MAG: hypothetical protein GEU94_04330 [Micromonosporaceae bacterium]|nr:hypothetical protein [Micromonosporaceae bacterium]
MLLMTHQGSQADYQLTSWPAEDIKAHIDFMINFSQELTDSGELVTAEGLSGPDEAKLVRASGDGSPAVTDGPFPETKEWLAGFWIVDCDSAERACQIAARASAAPGVGGAPLNLAIEVRSVPAGPPDVEM